MTSIEALATTVRLRTLRVQKSRSLRRFFRAVVKAMIDEATGRCKVCRNTGEAKARCCAENCPTSGNNILGLR